MLTDRITIDLTGEGDNIETVDEILENYGIKDLTLEDLQEKYVNDIDADYEEYLELQEKY